MVAAAQLAAEAWRSNACRASRPDKGSSWAAWVCFEPSLWRSSAETRLACLARTRAETWRCASECAALAVSQLLCFSVSSQSTAIKKRRKLKTTEIEKALTQKRGRVGLSEKETKDKKKKRAGASLVKRRWLITQEHWRKKKTQKKIALTNWQLWAGPISEKQKREGNEKEKKKRATPAETEEETVSSSK